MTTLSTFGIDAISTYVPKFTLNLDKLAKRRNVNPEKYRIGLGLNRMSVAGPQEDSLTLAVEAAQSLFKNYPIDKESVGMPDRRYRNSDRCRQTGGLLRSSNDRTESLVPHLRHQACLLRRVPPPFVSPPTGVQPLRDGDARRWLS